MMNLPTPLSRTIFRRRTRGLVRGADVRRHPFLSAIHAAALVILTCATPSSVTVVAQTTADQSAAVHTHAQSGAPSDTAAVAAFTLPENIPDFSQDTSRPYVETVASGNWSSAATWQGGQIPGSNHVVRVLQGHTVTINDTAAVAYTIAVDGKLAFAPTVNTRVRVTNLQVMAGDMGMGTPGVLEVGTTASPVAAGVTAEIIIANSPLGGSVSDTNQFGPG